MRDKPCGAASCTKLSFAKTGGSVHFQEKRRKVHTDPGFDDVPTEVLQTYEALAEALTGGVGNGRQDQKAD
jgi:hypothetical protein